ncbi:MAG: hypothetical protein ABW098_08005 [Candidatus Thiodiazotropha sp.]
MKLPRGHSLQYVGFLLLIKLLSPALVSADLLSQGFTNITGSAERMISYRHQERFIITNDGSRHLLVNLGNRDSESKGALALMQKIPGNTNWDEVIDFECTNETSTADMFLENDQLHIVYTCEKQVWYASLNYDSVNTLWWDLKKRRIFRSFKQTPSAPTIAMGNNQTLHVVCTLTSLNKFVQLTGFSSSDPLLNWDTTSSWGTTNKRRAKAGRLLSLDSNVGLIYTDVSADSNANYNSTLNFTRMSDDGSWSSPVILETTAASFHDPYGSHYSTSVDDQGNIHLIWPVEKRLKYYRYNHSSADWSSTFILEFPHNSVYGQVALHADGRIFLVYNIAKQMHVVESSDHGLNFMHTDFLVHSNENPLYDWAQPRVETPALFHDTLEVLQQLSRLPTETEEALELLYLFTLRP